MRIDPRLSEPMAATANPAATAAASRVAVAMGIVRRPKMRIVRDSTQRTFIHIGLAEQHSTRCAQTGHHMRVVFGRVVGMRQTGARRPSGDIEIVLDRHGNTVQPADDTIAAAVLCHARLLAQQGRA
jgi:hypothetical protein